VAAPPALVTLPKQLQGQQTRQINAAIRYDLIMCVGLQ
jgi:hypothetical protein